ncbi:hypothetical protein BC643_2841 [Mangrovibacterium diazotrophicum]|uniref:Uncharacterized protein n=1 Tax=Mangrovibacterium diazotrophicum TaxID=1261403 RepID=A0A419WAH7_9BACT|nr:hypothetical protein BC643_2841 [Mangrovibacterium diazotrophicum]
MSGNVQKVTTFLFYIQDLNEKFSVKRDFIVLKFMCSFLFLLYLGAFLIVAFSGRYISMFLFSENFILSCVIVVD